MTAPTELASELAELRAQVAAQARELELLRKIEDAQNTTIKALEAAAETAQDVKDVKAGVETLTGGANDTPIAVYLAKARGNASQGTLRTYDTHWRNLEHGQFVAPSLLPWLEKAVDTIGRRGAVDIDRLHRAYERGEAAPINGRGPAVLRITPGLGDTPIARLQHTQLVELAATTAVVARARQLQADERRRRRSEDARKHLGHGAEESFVAAMRNLCNLAAADNVFGLHGSPATKLKKLDRAEGGKPRMTDEEYRAAWHATCTDPADPELKRLLHRFHLTTGARQQGAIGLRVKDLDFAQRGVHLREKRDKKRFVPTTVALLDALQAFARSRGSVNPFDRVFVQQRLDPATGRPRRVTGRVYDGWHRHVQATVPWAQKVGWSSHWLRAHAAALIEDHSNPAVKGRFLGHAPDSTTIRYGKAHRRASGGRGGTDDPHRQVADRTGSGTSAAGMECPARQSDGRGQQTRRDSVSRTGEPRSPVRTRVR